MSCKCKGCEDLRTRETFEIEINTKDFSDEKEGKIHQILGWMDEYRGAFASKEIWRREFIKMLEEVL